MRKGRMVYVSRDAFNDTEGVELYLRKPVWSESSKWWFSSVPNGSKLIGFCYPEWLRITGFKIKPGECKRVRIRVEEVYS